MPEQVTRLFLAPNARESCPDDSGVVRPDRAVVVAHGVVAPRSAGECADTPFCTHVLAEQAVHDWLAPLIRHDTAPETVPSIRGDDIARFLLAIQRQVECVFFLPPEITQEVRLKRLSGIAPLLLLLT